MIYWLSSNFFLLYRRFKKWTPVTRHSTLPRFLLRNRKPPSPRSSFLAEEDKHSPQGGWQLFCFLYTPRYNSFVDLAIFTSGLISLACCFPMILTCAFNNGAFLKSVTLYRLFNVFCLGLPETTAILCVMGEFWVRTEHFQENLYC